MERVTIFDTTLRDGEQSPGVHLTAAEKLEIATELDRAGVDVIEAGFPAAGAAEAEAVRLVARSVTGARVAALARAVPEDIAAAADALAGAARPRLHVFIATSDLHLGKKLRRDRAEVRAAAAACVRAARERVEDVEFSPEDASRTDVDYLVEVLDAAVEAGATTLNVPDTVGWAVPDEYGALIADLVARYGGEVVLSTHCHDDLGLAVANTLAGLAAGARQCEVAVNGIGERAGNAALEEVVVALATREARYGLASGVNLARIPTLSRLVSRLTGMVVPPNKAVVGRNAFAHESGIHVHGVLADVRTYEVVDAAALGRQPGEIVLGKHSGRAAVAARLADLGRQLDAAAFEALWPRFKALAATRSVGDDDLLALVDDHAGATRSHLLTFAAARRHDGTATAEVTVATPQGPRSGTGSGDGMIDAACAAICAALDVSVTIVEFGAGALAEGADALGSVRVVLRDDAGRLCAGRGTAPDVVEATARAVLDALGRDGGRTDAGP